MASKLFLYLSELRGFPASGLAAIWGIGLTDQKQIDTLELGKTKSKAKHIRFEGCWVGESPIEMAAFGRIFGATDVSGFTWVSWTGEATVTLPKGIKAPDLSKFLQKQNLEKWLMPGTAPVPVLASMAKTAAAKKTLPLLWYQTSLLKKPPYEGNNFAQGGSHSYRSRSEATKRTVAAAKG